MRRLILATLLVITLSATTVLAAGPLRAGPPATTEKSAVVIGIDKFKGRTRPNIGAVGDAMAFREALLRAGWRSENILMLIDGDATAARIRSAFTWLAERSTDRSYSVFHYSGHTKQINRDRDRDGEALDEYLWPHDNVFISDGEFGRAMRAVRGWAWIDIAACEAAGFDDGVSSPRRLVTAASQEPEKAYEYPPWRKSVYTGLMIDEGMLQGKADANRDGKVSVTEAFNYAARRAPEITAGQKPGPQHPYVAGGDGGEWFLDGPPPPPRPPAPPSSGSKQPPMCLVGICVPRG